MINRAQKLYAVATAGLLHDIGKLYQRADDRSGKDYLLDSSRKIESVACKPSADGHGWYTHRHVLWTDSFWERHSRALPVEKGERIGQHEMDTAQNISVYHHSPTSSHSWQTLMQIADHCSSGMDRTKAKDAEEDAPDRSTFKKQRLQSCWAEDKEYSIGKQLSPCDESFFPAEKELIDQTQAYHELATKLESFIVEFPEPQHLSVSLRYDALQSALERTTWCVPSSTMDIPDIALYDHLRGTAAIAVALADFAMDNTLELDKAKLDGKAFRFVVLDMSGIQNFLYDMNPSGFKGMAKVLRARSFFVSAMLEAVEIALLKRIGLPQSQVIMNGGGKLVLLISSKEDHLNSIREFQRQLDQALASSTHGRLRILFGFGEAFGKDEMLAGKSLKRALDSAFEDLAIHKLRPLPERLLEELPKQNYEHGACKSCGKQPRLTEDSELCTVCSGQKEWGEKLVRNQCVHFVEAGAEEVEEFPGTGLCLKVLEKPRLDQQVARVYRIWENDSDQNWVPLRYHAHYVPREDEREPKTFEEIADCGVKEGRGIRAHGVMAADKERRGIRALGVMAADVDNLGRLFEGVLERDKGGFTTMLSMSRQLNFFFGGVLEAALRESKANIYTVYAGGDDMFFVGAWDEILDVAKEWSDKFKKFTGYRQHLSAGISLAKPGVPVHRLHEEAEDQLKIAKNAGKDSIAVWGQSFDWKTWSEVSEAKEKLCGWRLENDILTTGQAYRLLNYARRARRIEIEESAHVEDAMWLPHMRYDITRNLKDKDGKRELHDHLRNLTGEKREEFAKYYDIALTWAIYKTRQSGRKEVS